MVVKITSSCPNHIWRMNVDGSPTKGEEGGGVVLISPKQEGTPFFFQDEL